MTENLHEIHCGLLPLEHRFIVARVNETRWRIPAERILDLATEYYEREGWYEECELERDSSLHQPHGAELRDCIEVNGDLGHHARESRWSEVADVAVLISGDEVIPPDNDLLYWFEEAPDGEVTEMTDLPIEKQEPLGLLWFDDEWKSEMLNREDA